MPDVATELGCGRVTVWAWTKDPEFAAELAARRGASRDLAELHLAEAAIEAVGALRAIMGAKYAGPDSKWRIAAAEVVLRLVWPKSPAAVAIAGAVAETPPRDSEREAIAAGILAGVSERRARPVEADPCQ